jgi:hypothetical protein
MGATPWNEMSLFTKMKSELVLDGMVLSRMKPSKL